MWPSSVDRHWALISRPGALNTRNALLCAAELAHHVRISHSFNELVGHTVVIDGWRPRREFQWIDNNYRINKKQPSLFSVQWGARRSINRVNTQRWVKAEVLIAISECFRRYKRHFARAAAAAASSRSQVVSSNGHGNNGRTPHTARKKHVFPRETETIGNSAHIVSFPSLETLCT